MESALPSPLPPRADPAPVDALLDGAPGAPRSSRPFAGAALPPRSARLGAVVNDEGTTFALAAADATAVSVAILDDAGGVVSEHALTTHRNNVWSGFVPDVGSGTRYAYRVAGPHDARRGLRHDASRLLLDPYARAVVGSTTGDAVHGVVIDGAFDWGDDRAPGIAAGRRVIYETHVRGMTHDHPQIVASERGSFVALGNPVITSHLRRLGVTAVELLPVQAFLDRQALKGSGHAQYWGYDTIGFFAPIARYSTTGDAVLAVREFKQMVKDLHAAGIEVILDVVYNHTPEGDGSVISFRGIDNRTYYMLNERNPQQDADFTGCGNTVNIANPQTTKLVTDSLRYWVEEMHVDGFRFDVAPAMARRNSGAFDRWAAIFVAINADPVLSHVHLIAEPWDVASDGYQVGNFPAGWAEWNARFRDTVRDFWRGATAGVGELATRITGSQDIYARDARGPLASVNFVTCHDGFTLRDLVSYNGKHNLANGENDRDGTNDNRSWNHGVEGPTNDAAINELRTRQQRNMLATTYLAMGMPMILGGDELSRTQGGNNNPYNQDNAISWVDWLAADPELLDFVERLGALRQTQPVLQRTTFLEGRSGPRVDDTDCVWLAPDGREMSVPEWQDSRRRSVGLLLNGELTGERHADGTPVTGDTLLTLYHAAQRDVEWKLPADWGQWEVVLDTAAPRETAGSRRVAAGANLHVASRSVVVLRRIS